MSKTFVAYYPNWAIYGKDYQPKDIPFEQLTHINYAFAKLVNGEITLTDPWADTDKPIPSDLTPVPGLTFQGNLHQLQSLKASRNPNIQILICVGGWTESSTFSDVFSTSDGRTGFCQSAVRFLRMYQLDGIDIDWEFPCEGGLDGNAKRPEDGSNFTLLLQELRDTLTQASQDDGRPSPYQVTIATSASPNIYRHYELSALGSCLDYIAIMSYDFSGPWSATVQHHTNLSACGSGLSAEEAVQAYIAAGFPPQKLLVGVAMYGRGFSNASSPPLGQPFSGVPQLNPNCEAGTIDFRYVISDGFLEKDKTISSNGYQVYWDDQAKAAILYNSNDQIAVSLDETQSAQWKAWYVKTQGLGGIMCWELSQDIRGHGDGSLIKTIYDSLVSTSRK